MTLQSLEQQILSEYNTAHAFVALHPTVSVGLALVVGAVLGYLKAIF